MCRRKLEKLRKKLKSSQKEVQDLQSEFQVERDDFLETIRGAERELKLFTAIAKRHVSSDLLAMYEEQSTWDGTRSNTSTNATQTQTQPFARLTRR